AFVKIDAAVSQPSGQVKSQAPYGRRLPETGFPGNREHLSRMNPGMLNQRGLHGQAFRKGVVREELHPANVAQTPFISRGQAGADAEIILSEGDDIRPGLKVVAIEAGRMVVLFAGKHKAINLSGNDSASGLIAAVSSKPINK
ncbi:MAG: hypothetical protein OEZ04_08440, partial [Nitrospinota bacterium]|nr:hypothetical protein [Nitrospinota bacterium]